MYNTKNYTTQGGDKTVINGELDFSGAENVKGNIANQTASTATDVAGLKTDFNALLSKLKAAGIMEADD